jgi:Zn finger protein HypA/HybF involved in hydrogenase expression
MHETRFVQQIFTVLEEKLTKKASAAEITVNVRLSPLSHVSAGNLSAAFKELSKGMDLKGVSLKVQALALPLACNSCNRSTQITKKVFSCPFCGSADVNIKMDKEFYVESLDVKRKQRKSTKKKI